MSDEGEPADDAEVSDDDQPADDAERPGTSAVAKDTEPAYVEADEDGEAREGATSDGGAPDPDEPFIRYTNSMYRVITMVGAALVMTLGVSVAVISRMVSPPAPGVLTVIDLVLTIVLVTWYLMGLHIGLDLYEDRVVVSKKIGARTFDRDQVESVEPAVTWQTALLFSGRPLLIHLTDGSATRAYGCLPSDAQGQQAAVAELQEALGATAEVEVQRHETSMDERIEAMTAAARARQAGDDAAGEEPDDEVPPVDADVVDETRDGADDDLPQE